ncbi:MAG: homoserine O-acetyltransferase [Candidatus Gastranaerophilaceae bacterium]|jgi:homoserine O-acetyltransferase
MTEFVKKMTFTADEFTFVCGRKIKDVKMGYETWGSLNAEGTNAVYICAFHSGTGHAAGKYRETDKRAGYWNDIIGPDKPIDTNKYFVVSADNFCNLQAYNPDVVTTGPASINPETGKHYAMDFPVVTARDMTNIQYQLLRSLGVNKLQAAVGASLGGVSAYDWAVAYPDFVERVAGLGASPVLPAWTTEFESIWSQPIKLDPRWNNGNYYGKEIPLDGFALTMRMLSIITYSPDWARSTYGRNWGIADQDPYLALENTFSIEKDLSEKGYIRTKMSDPNHMIYLNKMVQTADISRGFPTYEDAIKTIKAKVLFYATDNDQLFALHHVREHYEKFIENGVKAEFHVHESQTGHMAVVLDTAIVGPTLEKFLNS